tara:strand:- start:1203 stop:1661 length:459 start_codon:yes stop_codon:yes gene_type:complete
MAHFAKLDEDNRVLGVHVVDDVKTSSDEGVEEEERGRRYLEKVHFYPLWKKCSYNTFRNTHKLGGTPFRGNYPGVGWNYDETNDIFIPPKPYDSWTLNLSTAAWDPPVAKPSLTAEQEAENLASAEAATGNFWEYQWNEAGQTWDLIDINSV